MDLVLKYFRLGDYFRKYLYSVISTSFEMYCKHFSRALFVVSLFYAVVFLNFDHITCLVYNSQINPGFVQDMCIQSGYIAHQPFRPFVGSHHQNSSVAGASPSFQYDYYAWIFILLLFQSFLTYIPWMYLHLVEQFKIGQLEQFQEIVNSCCHKPVGNKLKFLQRQLPVLEEQLVFVHNVLTDWTNRNFVSHFLQAQILAITSVVTQVLMLHVTFNRQYLSFGIQIVSYWLGYGQNNPVYEMFPFMATCHFKNYGPTGTVQWIDSLCTLNYNLVNAYIYAFLWGLYIFFLVNLSLPFLRNVIQMIMSRYDTGLVRTANELDKLFRSSEYCKPTALCQMIGQQSLHAERLDRIPFYVISLNTFKLTKINGSILCEQISELIAQVDTVKKSIAKREKKSDDDTQINSAN